jgi:hypothetical protein
MIIRELKSVRRFGYEKAVKPQNREAVSARRRRETREAVADRPDQARGFWFKVQDWELTSLSIVNTLSCVCANMSVA